jgi:hypothetical protein
MPDMNNRPMTTMVRDKLFNDNSPLTGVALATMVGRPYPTLMRELNPWDKRAKLSIDVFADIVKATGRGDLLRELAEYAGLTVDIKG